MVGRRHRRRRRGHHPGGAGTDPSQAHRIEAKRDPRLVPRSVPFALKYTQSVPVSNGERFDATGAGLLALIVTALVAAPHLPFAALGVLALTVPLFALHLRSRPDGFVPIVLLRTPAFLAPAGLAMGLSTVYFALLYAVPRLFHGSWTPGAIGVGQLIALMTGSALSFALAIGSTRLPRRVVTVILVLLSASAVAVAAFTPWNPLLLLAATLAVLATSTGQVVFGVRAMNAAPGPQKPVAIGLFSLAYQLGGALGPTLVVLLAV